MSEFLGNGGNGDEMLLTESQSVIPDDRGHPVRILMDEHTHLIKAVETARGLALSLKEEKCTSFDEARENVERIQTIADHLVGAESHYQREENVIFPYLEKHGITGPPAAMWAEHETIREHKKNFRGMAFETEAIDFGGYLEEVIEVSDYLRQLLANHFYKENNVLFQMALQAFAAEEWVEARREFDEIGYCCFTPEPVRLAAAEAAPAEVAAGAAAAQGALDFGSGHLFPNEIKALLDTLPLEVTFVDANDELRYFNRSEERLFIRTKASIGRKVHQCHPQKSIHKVNEIVTDFKSGKRDSAEFWIEFKGRFVHIRFFPVRDSQGTYLGAIEVVQDVTDIKKLEGEKRLL